MKFNDKFAVFGENVIIKNRWWVLAVFVALMLFSVAGLKRIVIDNSYKAMLDHDNPINVTNDSFQSVFGNSDYVFIMVEAGNTVNPEVLTQIESLSNDLKERLPFVKDIRSFADMEFMEADDENLNAGKLIEEGEIPTTDSALALLRSRILGKRLYRGRMTNDSLTQTGLFVTFETLPDSLYSRKGAKPAMASDLRLYADLDEAQKDSFSYVKNPLMLISPALSQIHRNEHCKFTATGVPIINYNVNTVLMKEAGKSFAVTLLIAIIILAVLYKGKREVLAPLVIIFSSVIATFGIVGWIGLVVSTFALIVALLMLVISMCYCIHIINHFRKSFDISGDRREAIRYTFQHSGWPCFLSALTTLIGFASFMVVDMVPVRNLGLTSAIGVGITYLLAITLLPVFFSFGGNKQVHQPTAHQENRAALQRWDSLSSFTLTHIRSIFAVSALLAAASCAGISLIKADTDFINLFGEKNQFVADAKHSTENLGSLYSYEVLIDLPQEGMARQPQVLMAEERLDSLINSFEITKFTVSVNDIVKDVNQTLHNGDTAHYAIPEDQNLLAQYLLLYEMAGGSDLEKCVDYEYKKIRHSVRIRRSTTDLQQDFDQIVDSPRGLKSP